MSVSVVWQYEMCEFEMFDYQMYESYIGGSMRCMSVSETVVDGGDGGGRDAEQKTRTPHSDAGETSLFAASIIAFRSLLGPFYIHQVATWRCYWASYKTASRWWASAS